MSLLMDALKRAEASKLEAARSQAEPTPPQPEEALSLEPLLDDGPKASSGKPLPDLAAHLDAVDADLAISALPEPPRPKAQPAAANTPAPAAQTAAREAVRQAFAAKMVEEKPSRLPLWLALGAAGIAALGIGGYVWYQVSGLNRNSLSAPSAAPRPATVPSVATLPSLPPSQVPVPPLPVPPPTDFAQNGTYTAAEPPADAITPPPRAQRDLVPVAEPRSPVRLSKSRPEADPALLRGHANLQRNEIELARRDFESVLQREPNNTDALLALAAIAARQGRSGDADQLHQRALVANPSDPNVLGNVLNGTPSGADPQTTESRLKGLLSAQPESAILNFALGNLYARQARWPDAQQAYFNAVAADGSNPDYLFNLAISLDHIRQPKLAGQHYRLALEAADKRPAGFDREQVRRRLGELQAAQQP